MMPRLEIRTAELQNANGSSRMSEFELNDAIHITGTITIVTRHYESRSLPCDKLKEGLSKTPIMKRIRGQSAELGEAVNENSRRRGIADRFRDLGRQRLAFDFSR